MTAILDFGVTEFQASSICIVLIFEKNVLFELRTE